MKAALVVLGTAIVVLIIGGVPQAMAGIPRRVRS